jgi:hypothetical protein
MDSRCAPRRISSGPTRRQHRTVAPYGDPDRTTGARSISHSGHTTHRVTCEPPSPVVMRSQTMTSSACTSTRVTIGDAPIANRARYRFGYSWVFAPHARVNAMIQFVSQELPLSPENACSQRHVRRVRGDQMKRTRIGRPSNVS